MDKRHVALLRGINVGRAKRVAMADLRKLFEELDYIGVQSLLNSGNVVFGGVHEDNSATSSRIGCALLERLGVDTAVTVLGATELRQVVADNPFGATATDASRLLVVFLNAGTERTRLAPLVQSDWAPEMIAIGSRAAYLWCPDGILAGRLWQAVDRQLKRAATARNWATVMKLDALASGGPARAVARRQGAT